MRFAVRAALLLASACGLASAAHGAISEDLVTDGTIEPAAVHPVKLGAAPPLALRSGGVWRDFCARYGAWRAVWNQVTDSPHRAFGPPIPLAGAADDSVSMDHAVRGFISAHAELFGTPRLESVAARKANHVWYVRYRDTIGGVPVLFADWEFRVGENGRLLMFGADAHASRAPLGLGPPLARGLVRIAATRGLESRGGSPRVEDGSVWLLSYGADVRLVYEERVHIEDPPGNWWALVDARDGSVLWRRNRVRTEISGRVRGGIHPKLPTDTLSMRNFPDLGVFVGASAVVTDALGEYSAAAAETVTVRDSLLGFYCDVNNAQPPPARFAATVSDPATVDITWDASNSVDAERDAYFHVNVVHAFIKDVDPTFNGMDYSVPALVNFNATCNSFWDGNGLGLVRAGDGCPNTATMPDAIYHEYGHGINDNMYAAHGSPNGMYNDALHEGMADVNAAFVQDDPDIAKGLHGPGTKARSCDNTQRWPQDRSRDPHDDGEIIAGAFWDLRQSVGLPLASHLEHFAKYGIPDDVEDDGVAMSEYFVETLIADDDDADLSNGTPQVAQIAAAFNAHGIGTGYFVHFTHTPLADQTPGDDSSPYPVRAAIQYDGPAGALDRASPALHYSINGSLERTAVMRPTGATDEFGANIPAQRGAIVRYWLSARDSRGGIGTDPPGAPERGVYTFLAGTDSTALFQNMETDPGWRAGSFDDDAVTGIWVRVNPNGTLVNGEQCAPEEDHTPGSGTRCWVTGDGNPAESPGLNDIDGGKTTLSTGVFDATSDLNPVIEYYRWFTNDQGGNLGGDFWRTYISNNDGLSWTMVENTDVSNNSWQRVVFLVRDYVTPSALMRMRFVARDSLFPSLVEAGVDDFRLLQFHELSAPPADVAFSFSPAGPNPAPGATTLRFTLPVAGPTSLRVFDLGGRSVRTLLDGWVDSGAHSIEWDGTDSRGHRAPSGPYFLRLVYGGREVKTKVMLVR